MKNLSSFDRDVLLDMLADYTAKYTRMLTEGTDKKNYAKCKLTIEALQKEIEARNRQVGDINVPGTAPTIPE
jgi:hypothetical protein